MSQLPDGVEYVRTTDVFDETNHPAGLVRAHRVASGVWARLLVHTGSVLVVFEDEPDTPIAVVAGASVVIPPARPHHVEFDGAATFSLEFHREIETSAGPAEGEESTGLAS